MTAGYPVPQSSARKYLSRGNTKVMLTTVPHHPLSAVFGHEKARQRISARDGRFQSVGTGSIIALKQDVEVVELSAAEKKRFQEAVRGVYEKYCADYMDVIEQIIEENNE